MESQRDCIAFADLHLRENGVVVCPCCGAKDGSGRSTVILRKDSWTCMECGAEGDYVDLVAAFEQVGREEAERRLAPADSCLFLTDEQREARAERERFAGQLGPDALGYLASRGFSEEQARRFGIGWDPQTKAVTIPYPSSPFYFTERRIDKDTSEGAKYKALSAEKVGRQPLFTSEGAFESDVLFVVEGQMDALALMASGAPAVAALCGCSNWARLADELVYSGFAGSVVVMCDSDRAGVACTSDLLKEFAEAGIVALDAGELPLGANDPADLFAQGPELLEERVRGLAGDARAEKEASSQRSWESIAGDLRPLDAATVASRVCAGSERRETYSCGIASLDRALSYPGGGAFTAGVFILGAISNVGKTTLAVQLADFVASRGRPVVFVSIEQGGEDLVAKSVSRLMGKGSVSAYRLVAEDRSAWPDARLAAVAAAEARYQAEIAPNMHIFEARRRPSVAQVRAVVSAVAAEGDKTPFVVIDYLQLLAKNDPRATDKQVVDDNVCELHQMARDLGCCVFAISSLNRGSYSSSVSMDSLKESGGIEYGCDVLLGLQPKGFWSQSRSGNEAAAKSGRKKIAAGHRSAPTRMLEVVVLKNRNAAVPSRPVDLVFEGAASRFFEAPEEVPGRD